MEILPYLNRDVSWLSFNERVLDEASDPAVPLANRVKFLAIYSSNLDEFFRVRVAALRSLSALPEKKQRQLPFDPQEVLSEIAQLVGRQRQRFDKLFEGELVPALKQNKVVIYQNEPFLDAHQQEAADLFHSTVLAYLQPVFVGTHRRMKRRDRLPLLESQSLYFALTMRPHQGAALPDTVSPDDTVMAYLNVPKENVSRFVELSPVDGVAYFAFLDDIIRANLSRVFPGYQILGCYSFKLNRAEDLNIDDEFRGNLVKKIKDQLARRKTAPPVRFLYDEAMPPNLLERFVNLFRLQEEDLMAAGRYLNLSDLMKLPLAKQAGLTVPVLPALPCRELDGFESMLEAIGQRDRLLHFPYQSYSYVLRFFNEAAIDPLVYSIQVALYRIAADSVIANALMSAARNGKRVTVFVEVKARYDEANNLRWAKAMKKAGVNIIYSLPGVKVHAKIALVKRRSATAQGRRKSERYAYLSTGNFNEVTAEVYTDHGLFTSHAGMVKDLEKVFTYLKKQKPISRLNHLLVAPVNLQQHYLRLIEREMDLARQGKEARLVIKVNGLEDAVMINRLYEASQAGVQVRLIIRGVCCLLPGVPGISEGVEVIRLVDQFLEHSRVAFFNNGGQPQVYLASADWMNRNLYHRIEVGFPIYDPALREEIFQLLDFQLNDTLKIRQIDEQGQNQTVEPSHKPAVRAQLAMYNWLKQYR
ncbi:polyphosphate kinase 1 [Larkinella arboricola]